MSGKGNYVSSWHRAFLIALVVLLALLMIFSRGYRAARRIHIPANETEQKTDTNMIQGHAIPLPDITKDMLLGHIDPANDSGFELIDETYASRSGMYMRSAAYHAFLEMRSAARDDGVSLIILSATRPFNHQRRIWENKWNGLQVLHGNVIATDIPDPMERALEILRFSAMPGTSRHHWGTDIDLNSLQNSYFESGEGKRVYRWLQDHADSFGFCQPYTARGKQREDGYEEEKWHWSYRPIASEFLHAYQEIISYGDIRGFDGDETAKGLKVIDHYVMGIDQACF